MSLSLDCIVRVLSHPKPDIEHSRIALRLLDQRKHQLLAAVLKNAVLPVSQSASPLGSVGGLRVNPVREGVVKIDLRRELIAPSGLWTRADLEVDMNSSNRIPTGIDRQKPDRPGGVRDLIAAQELLAPRVEEPVPHVRIDAERVAVPDIHHGARERRAGLTADFMDAKCQLEWQAFFQRAVRRIRPDVGAIEPFVHEIGALGLFRSHDAGRQHCAGCLPSPQSPQPSRNGRFGFGAYQHGGGPQKRKHLPSAQVAIRQSIYSPLHFRKASTSPFSSYTEGSNMDRLLFTKNCVNFPSSIRKSSLSHSLY